MFLVQFLDNALDALLVAGEDEHAQSQLLCSEIAQLMTRVVGALFSAHNVYAAAQVGPRKAQLIPTDYMLAMH
jgi:hypothetical protein